MKDFLIVADGDFLVKEIIQEIAENKIIIALGEAADKLARIRITPNILLGDFDSESEAHIRYWGIHKTITYLQENEKPYQGNFGVTIVPHKNQNLTDLIKAIRYCDSQNASSITMICVLGGRLDHHEAALRSLRSEYKKNRPIFIYTDQQLISFAKNETIIISGEIGDKCGVFAYPEGSFSSHGLTYDVNNYDLHFAFSESIANSLSLNQAEVIIKGEALLVMPATLKSQREFMTKTEVEKLEWLLRDAKLNIHH